MKWTKTGPDRVSGPYRIHAEGDLWHVDMPANGGMFDTVSDAKRWCSEHQQKRILDEHVAKVVAEAPPFSPDKARDIARLFDIEGSRAHKRAERQPHPASAPPPPGLKMRNLPGTPERSKEEVLASVRNEWEEGVAKTPMYSLWFTSPEDMFRWRVQFDCGCIEDWCNTSDDPQSLIDATRHNPFDFLDGKQDLPPGEYLCKGEHPRPDLPLREVESWDERLGEKVIPADPVEPPNWWVEAIVITSTRPGIGGSERAARRRQCATATPNHRRPRHGSLDRLAGRSQRRLGQCAGVRQGQIVEVDERQRATLHRAQDRRASQRRSALLTD